MSIFKKASSAARFVFVKMPASVLGVNTLRQNHQTIRALYGTLTNPLCPMCSRGVMQTHELADDDNPKRAYTWSCNRCEFMLLGGSSKESVIPQLAAIRQEQSLENFDGLDAQERAQIVKAHTRNSRVFLVASTIFFGGFLWMLLDGSGVLMSVNWAAIALLLFVLALKKSYRAWQVKNGVIYVQGAFQAWFNNEKWFH